MHSFIYNTQASVDAMVVIGFILALTLILQLRPVWDKEFLGWKNYFSFISINTEKLVIFLMLAGLVINPDTRLMVTTGLLLGCGVIMTCFKRMVE